MNNETRPVARLTEQRDLEPMFVKTALAVLLAVGLLMIVAGVMGMNAFTASGYDFFKALGENGVMIESGSTALAKLQTGECKEIIILEESMLKVRKEEGSKLACIYPSDGNIMIPSTVMTVAEDRSANMNIEACQAITDWLLSEEGQKYVLEGYMHSVFAGMKEVPFDSIDTDGLIETDMGVDWVRCYKDREEIRTQFQENVTIK